MDPPLYPYYTYTIKVDVWIHNVIEGSKSTFSSQYIQNKAL